MADYLDKLCGFAAGLRYEQLGGRAWPLPSARDLRDKLHKLDELPDLRSLFA